MQIAGRTKLQYFPARKNFKASNQHIDEWLQALGDEETANHQLIDLCPIAVGDLKELSAMSDGGVIELTVDSGAGDTVAHTKDHFPDIPMMPSAGSRAGRTYLGPGGEPLRNLGEQRVELSVGDQRGLFTFQSANVRKPLLAVSSINDKKKRGVVR